MRDGARIAAAIEILTDLEVRRRPAADAVKDWMLTHRFAGSKDRAAIGDLVFCALRWKRSSAWRMGADTPRAHVFGAMRWGLGHAPDALAALLIGDAHAPAPLCEDEVRALTHGDLARAPSDVAGDYPEWCAPMFARAFGGDAGGEGAAMAAPAPIDLRANTLRTMREKLLAALSEHPRLAEPPTATPYAPNGVRVPWRFGRNVQWALDLSFAKGWFEVQDEGSQLAALLSGARAGMQVVDLCAGAGGKTLALAAQMENKGQIYAFDFDERRLAPLTQRLDRAGVRNVQIRAPVRARDVLADLEGKIDLVVVDAPCTGSGTWRRNPDAKWRVRPTSLETRRREQQDALARAAPLVKPGGILHYVTCSVFPEENEDAVAAFRAAHTEFELAPLDAPAALAASAYRRGDALQMTPRLTGTDGFFIARLVRAS